MKSLAGLVTQLREGRLAAYRASQGDIKEHFGIEQAVLAGGYGYRQVLELVQNGADAILEAHSAQPSPPATNRIEVLLANSRLYVANTGAVVSPDGVDSLLRSHSSPKRGNQIGRFGLGFKSLLRLGGRIDLFSTTVAMRFDPERCRSELCAQFGVTEAPGLRLAWTLEEAEDQAADPLLTSFSWATTVVRADIADKDILAHLQAEIQSFPSPFLLFLPVPVSLSLNDGVETKRLLRREPQGQDTLLHDGDKTSRWRVVEDLVTITDERARKDATHIHARDTVPVAWAVPLDAAREEAGRFWAFFPTHTPTRLSGILNAPWKLNSDRNAIIGGEWNTALMLEAARLVARTLPALATPEDPARPLDAFPRQMDRQDEDAAPLVNAIWAQIEKNASIPNAAGNFCRPQTLWQHPRQNAEIATRWAKAARPSDLATLTHPTCLARERRSRLAELASRVERAFNATLSPLQQSSITLGCSAPPPNLRTRPADIWFSAVASLEESGALEALRLAEAYAGDCTQTEWRLVRGGLQIIPSDVNTLLKPHEVILTPPDMNVPGRSGVAAFLRGNPEALRILVEVMNIDQLGEATWQTLLSEALDRASSHVTLQGYRLPSPNTNEQWHTFWARARLAPSTIRTPFIQQNRYRIRARRSDGKWVDPEEMLLVGRLLTPQDTERENTNMLPDPTEHANDRALLESIGVADLPYDKRGPGSYDWLIGENKSFLCDWLNACRHDYYNNAGNNAARSSYLEPLGLTMPRGWMLLPALVRHPNSRLCVHFLALLSHGEFTKPVKFGHSTTPARYPKVDVGHPLPWLLLKHGHVSIGASAVPLSAVVARRDKPALSLISCWQSIQPYLETLAKTENPPPLAAGAVKALWESLFALLIKPAALADDSLRDLWSGAASDGLVPASFPTATGDIPLSATFVTGSFDLANRARKPNRLVFALDSHALKLWLAKGARNLDQLLKPAWDVVLGPPGSLISAIPDLAPILRPNRREEATSQTVSGLKLCFDDTAEPLPCLMWENILLLDPDQLARLSRSGRLRKVVSEIAHAGWLEKDAIETIRILCDAGVQGRRTKIAAQPTLAARLLAAVGGRSEPLLAVLGALAEKPFIRQCTPLQLADLVLAILGTAALATLKQALRDEGLNPPDRFNTPEARAFAVSIGFPPEFAASPQTRREPEESISGPIHLPPLHDFQEEVAQGLSELVAKGTGRHRAVVSLPTGGGKTRVVVQAAVDLILKPESDSRIVLWVAQTDELCEQAVQAFRQVWINRGAPATILRIFRLWGGNPNPNAPGQGVPVVVVASIQTLNSRVETEGLAWLATPAMVVVDECHHAITKSYTNLLRWLDAEAPRPGQPEKDEPPIIGLSATPFRGTDEVESERLARRFDQRWLPKDQERLYERLRAQGVLATADYEALRSPSQLLDDEITRLSQFGDNWEGIDFENLLELINQRLAADEARNRILLDKIESSTERSVLFFANSVRHAEEMAARLHLRGIRAAAVSGETPTSARRDFLDRFQRGEIRVLCNHTVLSTGFDAPKTDMVLIARQVFSPVRYMQMIGRGLRGEKNGGTARCRLVTVIDNLGRFADRHPYHFCARYFSATAP